MNETLDMMIVLVGGNTPYDPKTKKMVMAFLENTSMSELEASLDKCSEWREFLVPEISCRIEGGRELAKKIRSRFSKGNQPFTQPTQKGNSSAFAEHEAREQVVW